MDNVAIGIDSSPWKCFRNSRVEDLKLGCSPELSPMLPKLEVTKTKASGKCKEFPSPWWRWREIKQTKIGRAYM
jgi:hypothetical protein